MKTTRKIAIIASLNLIFMLGISKNSTVFSAANQQLVGRILLQVEDKGQAWYVNPKNGNRYFLGSPQNAFDLISKLGIGINNKDLSKIPIANNSNQKTDTDNDGLADDLEVAIGTSPQAKDSDGDGYDDLLEISNNHNPLGSKKTIETSFAQKHLGKIFLQVENLGQAWYINPVDGKRYFLNRPIDAFELMKRLGLGIKNQDLNAIPEFSAQLPTTPPNIALSDPEKVRTDAALAINKNEAAKFLGYFSEQLKPQMELSLKNIDAQGRENMSYILSNAQLSSSTEDKKTYTIDVFFALGNKNNKIYFSLNKQTDGSWLITEI